MSREYILLSAFEQKMSFSAIYKPKSEGNSQFFFTVFVYFGQHGGIFDSLHHHPLPATPLPPIVSAPSSF